MSLNCNAFTDNAALLNPDHYKGLLTGLLFANLITLSHQQPLSQEINLWTGFIMQKQKQKKTQGY